MKELFTLLIGIAMFLALPTNAVSQDTHRAEPGHAVGPDTDLPRIVRSNLAIPDNYITHHKAQRSAIDNKGTEFWLLMERNYTMDVRGIYLDITSDIATSGTVAIPGLSYSQDFNTTPGEITRVTLPNDCQVAGSETVENKGIHITSEHEVAVYGLNLKGYTSDCFLALPLDILSTQYLVMSYPNFVWTSISESTLGQFAVVSPYDNNHITITPTCNTYGGSPAGSPIEVTLNTGQTYQVRTAYNNDPQTDLTGTIVQSTLPVALFAGNSCASIPTNYSACDLIVEQIPPVSTWGNNFVTYPLEGRENGDTWRMLSSQNSNELYINGDLAATLNFGDFYECILEEPATINSSKPVLVMQFSNGDDYDPGISYNGDPFMMLIPPEEQFMDTYTFATPSEGFLYNYVTITIPTEGIASLLMDGTAADAGWFTPIGASGYSAAGIEIEVGSHTLRNTVGIPFGIYSYGFNGYDSYGYAGGLSLEFIYEGSAPLVQRTPATIDACQQNHTENADITIEVTATDTEEPYTQAVYLYYASPPSAAFQMAEMENTSGDIWSYTVPGSETSEPGIRFYFTATDGQLTSSDPAVDPSNNPYSMAILPNELPQISHNPVYQSDYNMALTVNCEVVDVTDFVEAVHLHYRTSGGNPVFAKVPMNAKSKESFTAVIPEEYVNENGTDYYITARDNFAVEARFPVQEEFVRLNQGVGVEENTHQPVGLTFSPNPFSTKANVAITMEEEGHLQVALYDLSGQRIRLFVDREMTPGVHHFTLKRGTLKKGMYLLNVKLGNNSASRKIVVE